MRILDLVSIINANFESIANRKKGISFGVSFPFSLEGSGG
jgi:hypothetical protein